jgi:hypothetical protein
MVWKTPVLLSLLFLGAAAAPPDGCPTGSGTVLALPMSLDLAGRPKIPPGLNGQSFAGLPGPEGANGCGGATPSALPSTTLRSESGDVLHGLPAPDILRPINEPRRSPQFQ